MRELQKLKTKDIKKPASELITKFNDLADTLQDSRTEEIQRKAIFLRGDSAG